MQTKKFSLGVYGFYAPKGYEFNTDHDREGWTTANLTDTNNGPTGGKWVCTATSGSNPYLVGPTNFHLDAGTFKKVIVNAANAAPTAQNLRVYWKRNGQLSFVQSRSKSVTIPGGGGWNELVVDMTGMAEWGTGDDITQLRIDPVDWGTGYSFGVDYVRYE